MRKNTYNASELIKDGILEIGDGYRAKNSEMGRSGLPFARAGNIKDGFQFADADLLADENVIKAKNKVSRPGDVVFTSKGTVGRFALVKEDTEKFVYSPQICYWRVLDQSVINPEYLYYWMQSTEFLHQVYKVKGLTDMADYVSLTDQRKMDLILPEKNVQNNIASVLNAYDNLIENNNRRIAILEEMAQSLYREWFVKFRFPGHDQSAGEQIGTAESDPEGASAMDGASQNAEFIDSPLGKIPEGWEVVVVEELVKRYQTGKKYNNKTALSEGEVPILDQGKSGVIGYHNDEPGVVATEDDPIIVFANHTCYQKIIHYPFSAIQNVLPFKSIDGERERDLYWLHFATKDVIEFNDYKGHWPEFMAKKIVLATNEVCSSFGVLVKPIERQKYKLECQVALLKKQRDHILPKLISGSIQI